MIVEVEFGKDFGCQSSWGSGAVAEGEASFFQTRAAHLVNRLKPCVAKKCKLRLDCIIILEVLRRYNGPVAMWWCQPLGKGRVSKHEDLSLIRLYCNVYSDIQYINHKMILNLLTRYFALLELWRFSLVGFKAERKISYTNNCVPYCTPHALYFSARLPILGGVY